MAESIIIHSINIKIAVPGGEKAQPEVTAEEKGMEAS